MSLAKGQVLTSRNFQRYRPIASPVAPLAHRLFTLLSSSSPSGSAARHAFFPPYLIHPHPDDSLYANATSPEVVEERIRKVFSEGKGPTVVLCQGAMSPYGLLESDRKSVRSEVTTTSQLSESSGDDQPDPADMIFIPYSLHTALVDSADDDDEAPAVRLMTLAALAHELAHWFALTGGGRYVSDATRTRGPAHGSTCASIATHQDRADWGTRAVEALWGHVYQLLAYADGSHELVSTLVTPFSGTSPGNPAAPPQTPLLSLKTQMMLLDGKPPPTLDVTSYLSISSTDVGGGGGLGKGCRPPWKDEGSFLCTAVTEQGQSCHHGACRREVTSGLRVGGL